MKETFADIHFYFHKELTRQQIYDTLQKAFGSTNEVDIHIQDVTVEEV